MNLKTSATAIYLAISIIFLQLSAHSQENAPIKFGKVTPEDFDLSKYKFDTSAGAVYIADVGSTEFEGSTRNRFILVFKRVYRIKILSKTGYDAATDEIGLYVDNRGGAEKLSNFKAATYNLENGKVVVTKMDEKSLFKDKQSRNFSYMKYTLPAVKEGSIIEVSYTIKSDFAQNLQPWRFQGAYPRLWSEYVVSIPEFYNYVVSAQGYHPFYIDTKTDSYAHYNLSEDHGSGGSDNYTISANVTKSRWVMKDVPPLKDENYITSLENYIAKLSFQFSQERWPNQPIRNYNNDWYKVSEELLKRENFGQPITLFNDWMDDDIKMMVGDAKTDLEKTKRIYEYVRDNFTCTDYYDFFVKTNLKSVMKAKSGGVADINMLLIGLLRHINIKASPVLMSTRPNGYCNEIYPLLDEYNYVIAAVPIGNQTYYLDASEPKLGFNHLPLRCYNGYARLIDTEPLALYFRADSVQEKKMTSLFVINGEKGKLSGSLTSKLGFYESHTLRKKVTSKGQDEFLKTLQAVYPAEYQLSQLEIDSLNKYEDPVTVRYNINMNSNGDEDIIYFNPMMAEGYKDNWFKAAERKYPVEMPYGIDETFVLNMEIPNGYVVDELPKSARVAFNGNEGMFEYLMGQNGNNIMLRSRFTLNKANFRPEDYQSLRGFFDYVVKKHAEQIVFKKKK